MEPSLQSRHFDNVFVIGDAAAFDAHQNTDHFASFGNRVADMVVEKTVQTWNRVGGAGGV